ncbi:MAG: protease inhibitor I42 family protein [Spirochaetaceae bacterium]|jgi:inhibitor of cysteine peptidase|nr:protease inhibitor I42 family protein [Spirochaetaceae bacterium]
MKNLCILIVFFGAWTALFAAPAREYEKQITIELAGNPTTGYSWTYTMGQEGIVREVLAEYRGAAGSGDSPEGSVGRGGVFVFVFEGLKPGTVELRFTYARPWESNVEPAKTKTFILTVNRAGGIRQSE